MVLVASPRAIGKTPVASGSSVPACPAFEPVRRRTTSTTRLEVRPSGLSTTSQPSTPPLIPIASALGVGRLLLKVARHFGPRQEGGDPFGPVECVVEREDEARRVAQANFPRDPAFEECGAPFEAGQH